MLAALIRGWTRAVHPDWNRHKAPASALPSLAFMGVLFPALTFVGDVRGGKGWHHFVVEGQRQGLVVLARRGLNFAAGQFLPLLLRVRKGKGVVERQGRGLVVVRGTVRGLVAVRGSGECGRPPQLGTKSALSRCAANPRARWSADPHGVQVSCICFCPASNVGQRG